MGKVLSSISISRHYLRLNNIQLDFLFVFNVFECVCARASFKLMCGNLGAAMHYNKVH